MRILATRPWVRAPVLLWRQPGLLLALAAAAFVAVLPAASAPLFLSSARTATLHNQLDNTCAAKVGLHLESRRSFRNVFQVDRLVPVDTAGATADFARRQDQITAAAAATPGVTTPVTSLFAGTAIRDVRHDGRSRGDLDKRKFWIAGRSDDFGAHLKVRQGPSGKGLWIPESFATELGIVVGDEIDVTTTMLAPPERIDIPIDPAAAPLPLRVAAVYSDLGAGALEPQWCTLQGLFGYRAGAAESFPDLKPVVFTDLDTMVAVATNSPMNLGNEYVDIALVRERPAAPEAHVMAARVADLRARIDRFYGDGAVGIRPIIITSVGHSIDRAELVYDTLRNTTAPATGAAVLIGLVVVLAAAGYWVQRREREVRLLAAHGASPGALAVKAALEALLALTAGAAAALAAAWALVRAFGPNPLLSAEAVPWAVGLAVAAWLAVLLVTAAGVGVRVRSVADAMPHRRWSIGRLPWELLLVIAAAAAWWLLDDSASVDRPATLGSVAHVPLRLLIAPVLGFLAVVMLGARLGARLVRGWAVRRPGAGPGPASSGPERAGDADIALGPRERSERRQRRRFKPGVFLAMRRIARPVAASALLASVTAVPVALTGFEATVTSSIRLTLEAKSAVVLGSNTVASLDRPIGVPPALADRATAVLWLGKVIVDGFQTDVVGIDPATFARGAFWNSQLPGPGLADLVSGVHAGPDPTGVSYGVLPAGMHEVKAYGERMFTVSVSTVPLLPGSQGGYPVLLVHRDALGPAAKYAVPQLWIRGDPETAVAELDRAGAPVKRLAQTSGSFADSLFEPVTFTFQYLIAVNVFAGLVVAAGLLLYVEARTPVYRRGYVLLRRLGLRRRAHLAALLLETGLPMAVGLLFGLLLAAVATWTGRGDLDLAAGSPPGPLIAVPGGVLVAVLTAVTVVALASGAFAQFRTVRAKPGEVLRGV